MAGAHNRSVKSVTRAEVLLNLGRKDRADVEGLRRPARSISRYTKGADGIGAFEQATGGALRAPTPA